MNRDEVDSNCAICFEQITSNGPHRLVALRCGHLFGSSCATQWINLQPKCPICKEPGVIGDIRPIFASKVVVTNVPELDRLREQLKKQNEKNKELEKRLKDLESLGIRIVYCEICDSPAINLSKLSEHEQVQHHYS